MRLFKRRITEPEKVIDRIEDEITGEGGMTVHRFNDQIEIRNQLNEIIFQGPDEELALSEEIIVEAAILNRKLAKVKVSVPPRFTSDLRPRHAELDGRYHIRLSDDVYIGVRDEHLVITRIGPMWRTDSREKYDRIVRILTDYGYIIHEPDPSDDIKGEESFTINGVTVKGSNITAGQAAMIIGQVNPEDIKEGSTIEIKSIRKSEDDR